VGLGCVGLPFFRGFSVCVFRLRSLISSRPNRSTSVSMLVLPWSAGCGCEINACSLCWKQNASGLDLRGLGLGED
jgi:hypothetical protein